MSQAIASIDAVGISGIAGAPVEGVGGSVSVAEGIAAVSPADASRFASQVTGIPEVPAGQISIAQHATQHFTSRLNELSGQLSQFDQLLSSSNSGMGNMMPGQSPIGGGSPDQAGGGLTVSDLAALTENIRQVNMKMVFASTSVTLVSSSLNQASGSFNGLLKGQ